MRPAHSPLHPTLLLAPLQAQRDAGLLLSRAEQLRQDAEKKAQVGGGAVWGSTLLCSAAWLLCSAATSALAPTRTPATAHVLPLPAFSLLSCLVPQGAEALMQRALEKAEESLEMKTAAQHASASGVACLAATGWHQGFCRHDLGFGGHQLLVTLLQAGGLQTSLHCSPARTVCQLELTQ